MGSSLPIYPKNEEEFRVFIIGLSVGCPYSPQEDPNPYIKCPLYQLRMLPPAERFQFVRELSLEELEKVWEEHHVCPLKEDSFYSPLLLKAINITS